MTVEDPLYGNARLERTGSELYINIQFDTDFEFLREEFLQGGKGQPPISTLRIDCRDDAFLPPYQPSNYRRREEELLYFMETILESEPQISRVQTGEAEMHLPMEVLYCILSLHSLKQVWILDATFMASTKAQYETILKGIQIIRLPLVRDLSLCGVDIGFLAEKEEEDGHIQPCYEYSEHQIFPTTMLSICPNLEILDFKLFDSTVIQNADWKRIFGLCSQLEELHMDVHKHLKNLLSALWEAGLPNLRKLRIDIVPEKEECERLAFFLTPEGSTLKLHELHYQFFHLGLIPPEEKEEALLEIAQALAENTTLRTFRLTGAPYVRGERATTLRLENDDQYWGLNDTIAEALLQSVRQNPRIMQLEASYEDPPSDIVQSIQTYLTVHKHLEYLLEEGNTPNNKLLWVHTLGLFRDDLNYLFCMLQCNPSVCGPVAAKAKSSSKRPRHH